MGWNVNFHITPHINQKHPFQPSGLRPSGEYGCLKLIWGVIWKLSNNNLLFNFCIHINIFLLQFKQQYIKRQYGYRICGQFWRWYGFVKYLTINFINILKEFNFVTRLQLILCCCLLTCLSFGHTIALFLTMLTNNKMTERKTYNKQSNLL